ncbi:dipeptidase 1-like isoform X2 [Cimex lectularius]|nr:dipeptidase 1-like isoform X2 [Cimex lectularius]
MSAPLTRKKMMVLGGIIVFLIIFIIILIATLSGGDDGGGGGSPQFKTGGDVILKVPLVVGRNGLPYQLKTKLNDQLKNVNFSQRLPDGDPSAMRTGHVGVQIWTVGVNCTATQYKDTIPQILEQIDVLKRYTKIMNFTIATEPTDLNTAKPGSVVGLVGLDGAYVLDSRPAMLRTYHELGVRVISLANICETPWTKMAGPNVLSPFAKAVVEEANNLGVMIDLTGTSKELQLAVMNVSRSPVVFTASNYNDLVKNSLNVGNETLDLIKKTNSLLMISLSEEQICTKDQTCNVDQVVAMFAALKTHVEAKNLGIGGGFGYDGKGFAVTGATSFSALFDSLHSKGPKFSFEDLKLIAYTNFANLFRSVKNKANLKADPLEFYVPSTDYPDGAMKCISDFDIRFPNSTKPTEKPPKQLD